MLFELPNLQGRHTFVNKRPGLMLSLPDREISLYVMDGSTYFIGQFGDIPYVRYAMFGPWMESYESALSVSDERRLFPWRQDGGNGKWTCEFEVVFHMVESDALYLSSFPNEPRKPEILALSFDDCQTFVDNIHCSLRSRKLHLSNGA